MGDIDQNQFQPNNNTNNEIRALQGDNVARIEAVPNGEAQPRHHMSTYEDDEKRWLVIAADEERSRGTGFMLRLKRRWDEQYPDKRHISKQTLRDNAERFKTEIRRNEVRTEAGIEREQDTPSNNAPIWTNEMKINLLKIEECERNRGRGFMKRMKEAWDDMYGESSMTAQTLRDNAARFRKDRSLLNLIEVRNGNDVEPDSIQIEDVKAAKGEGNGDENENIEVENTGEEDDETKIMRLRFEEILHTLIATTKENIEQRERLMKLKKGVSKVEQDKERVKRTHSLFIDDLKTYQENQQKLEIANETIVKASMDTGACYGVKKCAEIVFKKGKMIKGEGLTVLEEKMEALDPNKNEIYTLLGCEQANKIDVKRVMERVKKEIRKRLDHLTSLNLNDQNLMKAINSRVIPVAGYVMNVCHLGKNELDELDKLVKNVLRREGFHGRQSSDERLYTKRTEGGRGLKSFKEVYDETRTRVACYMATSTNEWIAAAWRNEIRKEQTSLKREVERIMRDVNTIVSFDEGSIAIGEEKCTDWKDGWTNLKKILNEGQKRNKQQSLGEKQLQSEIPKLYGEDDFGWLKCNTDPRKTSSIFALQEQMIETKAWKKIRGLVDDDSCRLCGEHRETVQHLLSGCKKLAGTEYLKRHDNALKVLAVKWAIKNGMLPEDTKWYTVKWQRGTVLERNGQKLFWDWEHRMRTNCTERRPDLTLEDSANKTIVLVDMACPMESNRMKKRDDKVTKYQQLCFEVRERREGYTVEVIPTIIGCLGGGMKELRTNIKRILKNYCDDNELHIIANEMQKTVLWESESIIRKTLSGLLT